MTRLFEAKPFIIAEVGSNWNRFDHCLESISVAKECGADAVKYQAYNHEALWGWPDTYSHHEVQSLKTRARIRKELPLDRLPDLKAECDRVGIEFMCTAFSPELLAAVDPYVEVHKIASSDAAWPQMLEAAAKTGKFTLISTGAKTTTEIDRALETFEKHSPKKRGALLLYCVANYPTDCIDLCTMHNWAEEFTVDFFTGERGNTDPWNMTVGLSDHTLGYTATVEAAYRGTPVIEKHFTAFPQMGTPDLGHSLTPKQFKRMVDIIRGREVESEETAMYLRHNRRLIATTDITAGAVLRYGENYGAYRSLKDDTRGASPFDWEKVEGRMAKGPIARGDSIALEDVE